jgi:hypothetical protein
MMTFFPKFAPDRSVVGLSTVSWPQAGEGYGRQRAVAILAFFGSDDSPESRFWQHKSAIVMLLPKSRLA